MDRLGIRPVALATATFPMASFVLNWFLGLVLPTWGFERLWEAILPGYRAGRVGTFVWGLLASAVSGLYIAVVFVPLYNFIRARD